MLTVVKMDTVIWLLQFMHLFPNANHCLCLYYFSWLQNTIYVSHFELHHSAVLERFCTVFSVYNVNLNRKMFLICKSNLWRANTVFQPYHSGIFVPNHHSILFSFIFAFRELDCMFVLVSDWVFPFLFFSRICVCSFKIVSFRWNAIFFSICR